MTEKDLKLKYLRDTGKSVVTSKYVEIEYDHDTQNRHVEIHCDNCGEDFTEIVYGQNESGTIETDVDCIDEDFYNWCIEKLLEYKNNDNKKIFYQLEENGSWYKGITFECIGNINNTIITDEGDILNIPIYSIREPINEYLVIEI